MTNNLLTSCILYIYIYISYVNLPRPISPGNKCLWDYSGALKSRTYEDQNSPGWWWLFVSGVFTWFNHENLGIFMWICLINDGWLMIKDEDLTWSNLEPINRLKAQTFAGKPHWNRVKPTDCAIWRWGPKYPHGLTAVFQNVGSGAHHWQPWSWKRDRFCQIWMWTIIRRCQRSCRFLTQWLLMFT